MENKIGIALVVLVIIVIGILIKLYAGAIINYTTASTSIAPLKSGFLVFGKGNSSAYSFNGAFVATFNHSSIFAGINTTTNPISVLPSNQTLNLQSNLSSLIVNNFKQRFGTSLQQQVLIVGDPVISKAGLSDNFALIIYAGGKIGVGADDIEVFTPNSTAQWQIYTNGVSYYVANATYNEYLFLYGNDSTMANMILPGANLNNSAVSTNSLLFPQNLLPYLDSLKLNANLSFVSDGGWWYSYFILYRFETQQVPAGFVLWK